MASPTTANVDRPAALGYGCAFGDRLFRLAVAPGRGIQIQTAPLEAPRINTTSSPEEAAAEFGLIFARSEFDGGEGLFRAHVEDAAPNRFWDSEGVSVRPANPGEFPQVTLLHETASTDALAVSPIRLAYDDIAGKLYATAGTTMRRTDDPEVAAPTWADDDPAAGEGAVTVYDVVVLGEIVYAALGANGIHQRDAAGTWTHWSDLAATRIWSAKGRIVASIGNVFYEVDTGGAAPAATMTLAAGVTIHDVTDGGSHVLVAADDGYLYGFADNSGTLALESQTRFEGEEVCAVGQSQGVVGVGTCQGNVGRFYVGSLSSTGQVVDLQLVRSFGVTGTVTPHHPHKIVGTRASLLVTIPDGTDTCVWRYDLITGGIAREICVDGVSSESRGLVVVEGMKFIAVDGSGVYREQSTYMPSGYLMGPLGDFYSSSPKSWIGARLDIGNLAESGGAVELYYATDPAAMGDPDSSLWRRVTRRSSVNGDPGEVPLTNVVARQLAGMVKLEPPTDRSDTPAVRSFSFRAYQSSGDEDRIVTLPVNVSDQIERRGRHRVRVKGRGATEYSALLEYEGTPVMLTLYRPFMTLKGLVEEVGTPVQAITHRGSVTVVSQVRFRGREVSTAAQSDTVGLFGTYHLYAELPSFGSVV